MTIRIHKNKTSVALTIAGSDSGGNAGIQADLLTMSALGVHGTCVITCLTSQNPEAVSHVVPLSPEFILEQLKSIFSYFDVSVIKTGMLYNLEIMALLADYFDTIPQIMKVIDPVMIATSGAKLLKDDAINYFKNHLLAKATLFTPNLDEAAVLLGKERIQADEMEFCAIELAKTYNTPCLLKGGHLDGDTLTDILAMPDGEIDRFSSPRIYDINTHGSGCTLSAAIASFLAKGLPLLEAVTKGRTYLQKCLLIPKKLNDEFFIQHNTL